MKKFDEFPEYIVFNPQYVDLKGKPVKRTPWTNPYNYDSFVLYKSADYKDKNYQTSYSDRMYTQNYKKYNECCKKIFGNTGQMFDERSPEDINKFLDMYLGYPVKLTAVLNCCNQSSGFPYFCFIYERITLEEYKKTHNVVHIISEDEGDWTGFGDIPWYFLNQDVKKVVEKDGKFTVYV